MKHIILNVLEKTYNSKTLRQTTVPLFMSNPGMGKTTLVKEGYIVKNMTQFGIDCLSHPECWEVLQ